MQGLGMSHTVDFYSPLRLNDLVCSTSRSPASQVQRYAETGGAFPKQGPSRRQEQSLALPKKEIPSRDLWAFSPGSSLEMSLREKGTGAWDY